MRTVIKRILSLLMSIMLLAALLPDAAFAAGKIIPDRSSDLTICFMDETKPIPGALFRIYRVADADENAFMTLTEDFEKYRSSVSGLSDINDLTQEEWGVLASSLKACVLSDELSPAAEGETGNDGALSVSGMEEGLYLVIGSRVTTSEYYTYTAAPLMLFLPGWSVADNDWNYDVTTVPKYTKDHNPPDAGDDHITRKVLKQWNDRGYEALRPEEISVQLLQNGKVFDTQTLNKGNNWRYTWTGLDNSFEWDIREADIPEGYKMSVEQSGITFLISNAYAASAPADDPSHDPAEEFEDIGDDEPPLSDYEPGEEEELFDEDVPLASLPQTGVLWWPVPVMFCLGIILLTLGVMYRRRDVR